MKLRYVLCAGSVIEIIRSCLRSCLVSPFPIVECLQLSVSSRVSPVSIFSPQTSQVSPVPVSIIPNVKHTGMLVSPAQCLMIALPSSGSMSRAVALLPKPYISPEILVPGCKAMYELSGLQSSVLCRIETCMLNRVYGSWRFTIRLLRMPMLMLRRRHPSLPPIPRGWESNSNSK